MDNKDLLLLALAGGAIYFYTQSQKPKYPILRGRPPRGTRSKQDVDVMKQFKAEAARALTASDRKRVPRAYEGQGMANDAGILIPSIVGKKIQWKPGVSPIPPQKEKPSLTPKDTYYRLKMLLLNAFSTPDVQRPTLESMRKEEGNVYTIQGVNVETTAEGLTRALPALGQAYLSLEKELGIDGKADLEKAIATSPVAEWALAMKKAREYLYGPTSSQNTAGIPNFGYLRF